MKKRKAEKYRGYAIYQGGNLIHTWSQPKGQKQLTAQVRKVFPANEGYTIKRTRGEWGDKIEHTKRNPTKRKSKRTKKPRVTIVRKNPLFRSKKSRTHAKYMLRAKFHHRDGYYYYGKDGRFYSRPKEPMTFPSEDIAKSYVFRIQSSLAKRFPFLHTLRAVRAA